jgi:hypothetical protein
VKLRRRAESHTGFFIDIEVMEFNLNVAIVRIGSDYVDPREPGRDQTLLL